VTIPVAVRNDFKEERTVTLRLTPCDAFELTDSLGFERRVDLKANDGKEVRFRIRARKIGSLRFEVRAFVRKTVIVLGGFALPDRCRAGRRRAAGSVPEGRRRTS